MKQAGSRILVVDDEIAFRRAMERLVGDGHEVTGVEHAGQALALLRGGVWFDVIICDMRMPDLGGFELFDEIERVWPEQAKRMLFITGGGYPHEESSLRSRGRLVLRKPSSAANIRASVESILHTPVEGSARLTQEMPAPFVSVTRRIGEENDAPERDSGRYSIVGEPSPRRKAK